MKKTIAFMLSSIILFLNICVPVKAEVSPQYVTSRDTFFKLVQDIGVIGNYPLYMGLRGMQEIVKEFLEHFQRDEEAEQITSEQDAYDFINTGINVVGDNNVVLTGDTYDLVKYVAEDIQNNYGYTYVYTTPLSYRLNDFVDGTKYNAVRQFLNEHPNSVIELSNQQGYDGLFLFDNSADIGLIKGTTLVQSVNCVPYSISTWVEYSGIAYEYSNGEFIERRPDLPGSYLDEWYRFSIEYGNDNLTVSSGIALSKNVMTFVMFNTLADLKSYSVGELPYYINSSVYQDFSQSSGDYTITSDNSNKISYGDITTYVDSFNTTNGEYPTPNDIQIYIDNNIPDGGGNNDNPNNGGGSGTINNNNSPVFNNNNSININIPGLSGNSVSGNGNGGFGGIFDWLGTIGQTLGQLVKGLGELISNLFEGIVEAVTTILESVPNILTPLIAYIFGGLPEEMQAMLTLGITCIIMVAVIKAIKG